MVSQRQPKESAPSRRASKDRTGEPGSRACRYEMSIESLTEEIALARSALEQISDWPLDQLQQAQRLELCERLARLFRFRDLITARRYSEGAGDWITPEEFANFSLPSRE